MHRVLRSELTVEHAALVLGIGERQCYLVKARVNKDGAKGVVHGNDGPPCKSKIKEKTVKRIVFSANFSNSAGGSFHRFIYRR